MISWYNVIFICLAVFAIAVETSGHAFKPELHFSWWSIAGWVFFIITIIFWEIGRK